ncbi:BTB/POZ domain-containing protein KCTD1, putative [Pediculus humanus corporis]|uniref:BTB/POZ domain-containing protein KCTD1, putative n=1 Tax=Pediculus humanus subsp. corporis TaxID=121224 RepID=E0VZS9_PEDHC|nr:BTB/POZ domain-containing protein KCTD1, putative [Pediculus humanus corporis]EEB18885.1 BTB/POZ domain-containing protein KCTD1, putative [Pediculus humanus corporis]
MFRHILNFMRNSRLLIPENFQDLDLLIEEARYFDITPKVVDGNRTTPHQQHGTDSFECVALHISPDLGERIMLSGDRSLLDEVFPEANQGLIDSRSGVAWNQHDTRHVIRFPLNGYCKLNSVQAITRLLNAGFNVAASNGGGVEGQQFSEYLFVRKDNLIRTQRLSSISQKGSSRLDSKRPPPFLFFLFFFLFLFIFFIKQKRKKKKIVILWP